MKSRILIFLLIILVIASFFRLWQLSSIPPGLFPDEAINANQGWTALETNNYKVFYPENHGREGLFINLLGLSFYAFGVSLFSLKIVSAIFGILAVIGIFLLTKEIINEKGKEVIALLSAFFLATSFWHTNFSRIAFRAILVPFVLTFSFYFLFKGFRTKKLYNFVLAGVFYGIGFHTYISFRLSVLLLGVILLCWFLIYLKKKELKKFILLTLSFLIFTSIVASPIAFYFLQNPQDFIGRATPISVFAQENSIKAFAISSFGHLGMFNFYGDPNWRHNSATSPMLPWFLGILFLVGVAFSIKKFFFSIKNRDLFQLKNYLLIIGWFFIMLLPGMLTFEGIPHALRVIGVIPIIYIFVALGSWQVYIFLKKKFKKEYVLVLLCVLLIASTGIFESHRYFSKWAKNPEVEAAFTKRFVKIGDYLNNLPSSTLRYVITNEGDLPPQTVLFIQKTEGKEKETIYLSPNELNKIKPAKERTVIILMAYDENIFRELKNLFPQGEIKNENDVHFYDIAI